jgi:hypothetical protein
LYWIGAMPVMAFVARKMTKRYFRSGGNSVPGRLHFRFNEYARGYPNRDCGPRSPSLPHRGPRARNRRDEREDDERVLTCQCYQSPQPKGVC